MSSATAAARHRDAFATARSRARWWRRRIRAQALQWLGRVLPIYASPQAIDAVILLIISHLLRLTFAKAAPFLDGQPHAHRFFRRLDACRRRACAGRAEPNLFLPRAPRHGTGSRRRRRGPARPARGDRRGLGAEPKARSAAA